VLFLFFGFGAPGVLGLLSGLLPFLAGGLSVFKLGSTGASGCAPGGASGGAPGLVAVVAVDNFVCSGTISLSLSFLPKVARWKSPGCPVITFSSIYSSPYLRAILSDSSRSLLSVYVSECTDWFEGWRDFLLETKASGRGVGSLLPCASCDSGPLELLEDGGGR
jgi:hypothetical protein